MNFAPSENRRPKTFWLRNISHTMAFWGAYLIFAGVGSAVSITCLLPAALFHGAGVHRFGQRLIHGLFPFFISYARSCGLLKLDGDALSTLRDSRGLIFPVRDTLRLGKRFEPSRGMDVKRFGSAVEDYFRGVVTQRPVSSDSFRLI